MALIENHAAFLADFGTDASLNGRRVRGLLDQGYGDVFGAVSGLSPVFRLPSSNAVAVNDLITIEAQTWRVVGIEPDGLGMSVLRLESF